MPAQPPFLTPTRTPMIVLAAFAITYLMRSAAASVSRITCGLGRELAIADSFFPSMWDAIAPSAIQPTFDSPHIEHGTGLVRHPALLPGRIPDDRDLDLADAGDARHRVLDHDGQFLRRRAVRRGQGHVQGDRTIVGDVDLVDETELVDIGRNFR